MKLFSIWKVGAGYGDIREIIVAASNEEEAMKTATANIEFGLTDVQITEIDINMPKVIFVDYCGR